MKIVVRLILLAGLIALGVWLWTALFPGPEKIIRKKLADVAKAASFGGKEGPLAIAGNVSDLVGHFSRDAQLTFDGSIEGQYSLNGRDEIQQAALAARQTMGSLSVEFLEVNVALAKDKQSATANLAAKARMRGETDANVQELKFALKKVNGNWLITRVETVKALR